MRSIRVCRTAGEWYPGQHDGMIFRSPAPVCSWLDPADITGIGDGEPMGFVPVRSRKGRTSGNLYPRTAALFGSNYTGGSPRYVANAWDGNPGIRIENDATISWHGPPGIWWEPCPFYDPYIGVMVFVPYSSGSNTKGYICRDEFEFDTDNDLQITSMPDINEAVVYEWPNVLVHGVENASDESGTGIDAAYVWFQGEFTSSAINAVSFRDIGGLYFLDAKQPSLRFDILEIVWFAPVLTGRYDLTGMTFGELGRKIAEHYRWKWHAW